jgi:CheY-specific phosphatase CheX
MAIECEAEISQFVTDIWSTLLNMTVSPTEKPFAPKGKDNTLAGCVQISGEWQGTVALYAPMELGKKIAKTMFGLDETAVDNQKAKDIIAEITNIIAGNIKAILPSPCSISLPSVAITDYDLYHPGSQPVTSVNFECEGLSFLVVMLEEDKK